MLDKYVGKGISERRVSSRRRQGNSRPRGLLLDRISTLSDFTSAQYLLKQPHQLYKPDICCSSTMCRRISGINRYRAVAAVWVSGSSVAGKYPTYWNIGGGGSLGLVAALDIGHGEPPAIGLGQPPLFALFLLLHFQTLHFLFCSHSNRTLRCTKRLGQVFSIEPMFLFCYCILYADCLLLVL